MKQQLIDNLLHDWLSAKERIEEAKRQLRASESSLADAEKAITQQLLPDKPKPEEVYIFCASNNVAIRCGVKEISTKRPDLPKHVSGEVKKQLQPYVEEHQSQWRDE